MSGYLSVCLSASRFITQNLLEIWIWNFTWVYKYMNVGVIKILKSIGQVNVEISKMTKFSKRSSNTVFYTVITVLVIQYCILSKMSKISKQSSFQVQSCTPGKYSDYSVGHSIWFFIKNVQNLKTVIISSTKLYTGKNTVITVLVIQYFILSKMSKISKQSSFQVQSCTPGKIQWLQCWSFNIVFYQKCLKSQNSHHFKFKVSHHFSTKLYTGENTLITVWSFNMVFDQKCPKSQNSHHFKYQVIHRGNSFVYHKKKRREQSERALTCLYNYLNFVSPCLSACLSVCLSVSRFITQNLLEIWIWNFTWVL